MYKAKVEMVDGWRVRAGGKWLQCIGNRAVHVGDFIWTDGRCVYGYDQESMTTPLVITINESQIEGVPIVIYRDKVYIYVYDTHKRQLVHINDVVYPKGSYIVVTPNKEIYGVEAKIIQDDSRSDARIFCDGYSNIYVVKKNSSSLIMQKNGNTFNEMDGDFFLVSAMVESEDNWWVMYRIPDDETNSSRNGHFFVNGNNYGKTISGSFASIDLPLHNGFKIKYSNLYQSPNTLAEEWSDQTVCSPEGDELATIFAPATVIINAIKISVTDFLISYYYNTWGRIDLADKTGSGLLLCKKNATPEIIAKYSDPITSSVSIKNCNMHIIKNYRNLDTNIKAGDEIE